MSEYIYKLADGAGADEFQMRKGEYEYCLVGHEAILSFAKSIIDECGNFTDPITRGFMKKHFGVEE